MASGQEMQTEGVQRDPDFHSDSARWGSRLLRVTWQLSWQPTHAAKARTFSCPDKLLALFLNPALPPPTDPQQPFVVCPQLGEPNPRPGGPSGLRAEPPGPRLPHL